ncbi:uncharacterized protein LOC112494229 [Cephus cinctus]|uniref:Uncharacterized protein LOC112494229 n=1 Tax=Cephus cinctus TaxID=211228 RepID=A0AAJ7W0G9_CEPCN|nr:uncharacterized protein LOC112494229 [Cephus cinctus]
MVKIQQSTGSALMSFGEAMSSILYETRTREAFILPDVTKQIKDLLGNTKTYTLLFENDLTEIIKETRTMEKISQNIKNQEATKDLQLARQN